MVFLPDWKIGISSVWKLPLRKKLPTLVHLFGQTMYSIVAFLPKSFFFTFTGVKMVPTAQWPLNGAGAISCD